MSRGGSNLSHNYNSRTSREGEGGKGRGARQGFMQDQMFARHTFWGMLTVKPVHTL